MKKLMLLGTICAILTILAGCSNHENQKQSEDTVKIHNKYEIYNDQKEDDVKNIDKKIEVPHNPKKIAVSDYGILDTLQKLGLENKVVSVPKGEGKLPKFISQFNNKKYHNNGDLFEANYNQLAKDKPDILFISGRSANQKNIDEVKKASPSTKIVNIGSDDKNYLDSIKENTNNLGKIFDKEKQTKKINSDLNKKIKQLQSKNKKDKAMFLLASDKELSTFGSGDRFGNVVYDIAGFKPVDKKIKKSMHGQTVSNEYIESKNPELIFSMDRGKAIGEKPSANQSLNNHVIKEIKAIKNDNIIPLDPYLWYLSSDSTSTVLIKQLNELNKAK